MVHCLYVFIMSPTHVNLHSVIYTLLCCFWSKRFSHISKIRFYYKTKYTVAGDVSYFILFEEAKKPLKITLKGKMSRFDYAINVLPYDEVKT